jgi:ParB family chromosome partitioning protein
MFTLVNVDKLFPHPDNPRKDLGDLSELAESIRQKGILQNLTVVPLDDGYRVVIGHRRLAAAKLAGIDEVPCVICEMSPQDQISTMLIENVQRNDLTVYEQACGFQMALDFGETVETLAQKTGFSESTVRRRVKLMELDSDKLREAAGRKVSLGDFELLSQIDDLAARNEALEKIGTRDFDWAVKSAIRQQAARKNRDAALAELDSYAKRLDAYMETTKYAHIVTIYLADWVAGKAVMPNSLRGQYYYYEDPRGESIGVYCKNQNQRTTEKRPQEEIDREKAVKAREVELRELTARAFALRSEFIIGLHPTAKMLSLLTVSLCKATLYHRNFYVSFEKTRLNEGGLSAGDAYRFADLPGIFAECEKAPERATLLVLWAALGDAPENGYWTKEYGGQKMPRHDASNTKLDLLYEIICGLGYQMSDAERSLQDGTHSLFQEEKS